MPPRQPSAAAPTTPHGEVVPMRSTVTVFRTPKSLVEEVVRVLTERIVHGEIPPGTRLIEERVAEEFGISRPPIRESFRVLEREGLVEITPRRGARVPAPSPKEIEDLYACRAPLEALAARLATRRMTPETLQRLTALFDEMVAAVEAHDGSAYLEHHEAFHELVERTSDNEPLQDLIRLARRRVMRLRYATLALPHRLEFSLDIHRHILQAFRNGDEEAAARHTAHLIESAGRELVAHDLLGQEQPTTEARRR